MLRDTLLLVFIIPLIITAQNFVNVNDNFSNIDVGVKARLCTADIDGDGLLDLLVGSGSSSISHFEQDSLSSDSFSLISGSFADITVDGSGSPTFTDIDGDGLLDLLVGSTIGNIHHYEQNSVGSYNFNLRTSFFNSIDTDQDPSPFCTDIDGDGLLDLLLGDAPGNIYHYEQDSLYSQSFSLNNSNFNSIDTGNYSTPALTDIDSDNLYDLIIGSQNGNVSRYEQQSSGSNVFSLITSDLNSINVGWGSPAVTDIDNDGYSDLLIGDGDGKIRRWESDTQTIVQNCIYTNSALNITGNSVTLGGDITDDNMHQVIQRGIFYSSTDPDPGSVDNITVSGSNTGIFSVNLNALVSGTTYYYRSYCISTLGLFTSEVDSFTTTVSPPAVETDNISSITGTSAVSGGTVTDDGGYTVTARGVCWSTVPLPETSNFHTIDGLGTGHYTSSVTGLISGTEYFIRAYATNDQGTAYGSEKTFVAGDNMPEVTTTEVDVSGYNTESGGNVLSDSGFAITGRGVCWSSSVYPTLSDFYTSDGSGTGSYTSILSTLSENTEYFVRAYATNENGTNYGDQINFTTQYLPDVTTKDITVTLTGFQTGGNVVLVGELNIVEKGICWSIDPSPDINDEYKISGSGEGPFDEIMVELEPDTQYYVKAYAKNSLGISYGEEKSATTLGVPVLSTNDVTDVKCYEAVSGGNITSDSEEQIVQKGVCWSTENMPDIDDSKTIEGEGTGSFISSPTGLSAATTYHLRAYATSMSGTGYGDEKIFTTEPEPVVTISEVFNISDISADSGGDVTDESGDPVIEKGVCWNTVGDPTTSDEHTIDGSGSGSFISAVTGLSQGTQYYIRAFATNNNGTGYSTEQSFVTDDVPSIQLNSVISNSDTYALVNSEVVSENGDSVTEKGICWSSEAMPDTTDNKIVNGLSGEGIFSTEINNLTPSSLYYVRSYAVNSVGISYSEEVSFYTLDRIRNRLYFNGSDQFVTVPFQLPDTGTIETWIYLDDKTSSHTIFDASNTSSNFKLNYTSFDGYFFRVGSSSFSHENYTANGKWHHLAVSWNKRTVLFTDYVDFDLYLNGTFVDFVTGNIWNEPDSVITIGASYNGQFLHEGYLDEFRIWNYQRTPVDIQNFMHKEIDPATSGLVCYYDFDQSSGITVNDISNYSHNGILNSFGSDNWQVSTVPVGDYGLPVMSEYATSTGESGKEITVDISSIPGSDNFLGIYTYGTGLNDIQVESLPMNIVSRKNIVWGSYEFGTVISDVQIDYSGIGMTSDMNVRLLGRNDALSEWSDITDSAAHDEINGSFIVSGLTDFREYAIGIYIMNSPLNVITEISGTDLILSWDPVSGATSYKVYSSDDPYGDFSEESLPIVGETCTIVYTESKKFYYVVAVNETKSPTPVKNKMKIIPLEIR